MGFGQGLRPHHYRIIIDITCSTTGVVVATSCGVRHWGVMYATTTRCRLVIDRMGGDRGIYHFPSETDICILKESHLNEGIIVDDLSLPEYL